MAPPQGDGKEEAKKEESKKQESVVQYRIITSVGHVDQYQIGTDFEEWCDRFESYCVVNRITEKVHTFITLIGEKGYHLAKALVAPKKPTQVAYEELKKKLSDYFDPKPSVVAERAKFRTRFQREDEPLNAYVAELRSLAQLCGFKDTLEDSLRDQITLGVSNVALKKKLYEEPDLSYARCLQIIEAWASAEKSMAMSGTVGNSLDASVNAVQSRWKNAKGKREQTNFKKNQVKCSCCGFTNHTFVDCYHKHKVCDICKRKGHLSSVCFKNPKNSGKNGNFKGSDNSNNSSARNYKRNNAKNDNVKNKSGTNFINEHTLGEEQIFMNSLCGNINGNDSAICPPTFLNVMINGTGIKMQVDNGSPIATINDRMYRKFFNDFEIKKGNKVFTAVDGAVIDVLGYIFVNVKLNEIYAEKLMLYIVKGQGNPLLGRAWFKPLGIEVTVALKTPLNMVNVASNFANVIERIQFEFKDVFSSKLGTYNKRKFSLNVQDSNRQKFFRPRSLPFILRDKVESELGKMLTAKQLIPVETSRYGTPLVVVPKANGAVRICGDYKVTINPDLIIDRYPLPRPEELILKIAGCKFYSKIDLSHAYQQLELDDESSELLTLSTHRGLFRPTRLMYGVASAPGIFQREMEIIFQDMAYVACYLDDILIGGRDVEHHEQILRNVLSKLKESGLTVNREKCSFFEEELKFLGMIVNKTGIKSDPSKVKAIVEAKKPENVLQLQSFLGMITYLSKFLPNASSILYPLNQLLCKGKKFEWTEECNKAFCKVKKVLIESNFLVHFDPKFKIKVKCDASPYGIGAVLMHEINNKEYPIAFVSRTLTNVEKRYSQLDREALAIIFGLNRFHKYLYGIHFVIQTDHKPLTFIFGEKKNIPVIVANRIQRYAMILAGYNYTIEYLPANRNVIADMLSRLPLESTQGNVENSNINFVAEVFEKINRNIIVSETRQDPELRQIIKFVVFGWPNNVNEQFKSYMMKKFDLTYENQCLFLGHKIVIPQSLRSIFLQELHKTHLGVVKMKSFARAYFWWPTLNREIEQLTKSCHACSINAKNPRKVELHKWIPPIEPGRRVHADLCYIGKNTFLVITDAFSKWPEIFQIANSTSFTIIKIFKEYLARWGLIEVLVTDNGPPFNAKDFNDFLEKNGVNHMFTPPYHPQSNGAAENCVATFKDKVKKALAGQVALHDAVQNFLLDYRSAMHATTCRTPAELHLNRRLRTRFDVMLKEKEDAQIGNFGGHSREIVVGDSVMARQYRGKEKWVEGRVTDVEGKVICEVEGSDGEIRRRHVDQLRVK